MKIKYFVSGAIGTLLVVTASGLSYVALDNSKKLATDSISKRVNETSDSVGQSVRIWQEPKKQWLDTMAAASQRQNYTDHDLLKLASVAEKTLGVEYAYVGKPNCEILSENPGLEGYKVCDKPWFTNSMASGSFEDKIHMDTDVNMGLYSMAKRLTNKDGKVIGVAGVDVSVKALKELVNDLSFGEKSVSYIFDDKGNVVAGSDGSNYGAFSFSDKFTELNDSIELAAKEPLTEIGENNLGMIRPIGKSGLYIGAMLDKNIEMKDYTNVRNTLIGFSALIVTLSILFSFFAINSKMRRLDDVNNKLREISTGNADLTIKLDETGDDEVSDISKSYNNFISMLNSLIGNIKVGSNQIQHHSDNTLARVTETDEELTKQNDAVNSVAAAIDEMAAATALIAENASNAAAATETCSQETLEGDAIFSEMLSGINELSTSINNSSKQINSLSEHSDKITVIVERIQDIAEQTNLLALNAAIEAARAGEAGRGFAVVADEVRLLSDRTRQSTAEIESMVQSLQVESNNAVSAMDESVVIATNSAETAQRAGDKLTNIKDAVEKISDQTIQISAACEQQSVAADEISSSTSSMQMISQNIMDLSGQAKDRTQDIMREADEVTEVVNQFKID